MRIRQALLLGVSVSALLGAASALAYIPPSQFVLKKMAGRRGGFKGVRVRTTVIGLDNGRPTGAQFTEITLYSYDSRHLRSQAVDEVGNELYSVDRSLPAGGYPVTDALLFEAKPELLAIALKSSGIPIRTEEELAALADEDARQKAESSWLERIQGTSSMAWVFGVDRKATDKPQLWVEKDGFLPLRYVGRQGGDLVDLRFENYRYYREFPYPRLIDVAVDGQDPQHQVLRAELAELAVNPDLAALKSRVPSGFTEAGNRASTDVRNLIQRYYQLVR